METRDKNNLVKSIRFRRKKNPDYRHWSEKKYLITDSRYKHPSKIQRVKNIVKSQAWMVKKINKIEDEIMRQKVACIVWWDNATCISSDLYALTSGFPKEEVTEKELYKNLLSIGYSKRNALRRSKYPRKSTSFNKEKKI